ncbi:thioesterase-like superfamily-domain-containing protein [Xylaria palmicola]|nr:thioesterase-like superfamily-domain-containing protein [Xylaria palmicola]
MISILKKQIELRNSAPGTYTASWHLDWTIGPVLLGGCVAAIVYDAAETHLATDPILKAKNQPNIVNLHLEFLCPCVRLESTVSVTTLRTGAATSTLQLQLAQGGQIRVIALATAINFDRPLGPTVSVPVTRALYPSPKPKPDIGRVLAQKPDRNWVAASSAGEIVPLTRGLLALSPRGGFTHDGICDAWSVLLGNERLDGTYLTAMTDIIPSLSDTLLRNGGIYDAHRFHRRAEEWAEANPGIPAMLGNTLAEALQSSTWDSTLTLDIEFTRKLPADGLRAIFTRTVANALEGGKMNLDVTICNEDMELLCTAHQLILVLETGQKFREGKKKPRKEKL